MDTIYLTMETNLLENSIVISLNMEFIQQKMVLFIVESLRMALSMVLES